MSIQQKLYRSGPFQDYIAEGVLVHNLLYVSGQIGIDQDGEFLADIAEQAKLACCKLQGLLAQFNADKSNIVDETCFTTDLGELMGDVEEVYGVKISGLLLAATSCQNNFLRLNPS